MAPRKYRKKSKQNSTNSFIQYRRMALPAPTPPEEKLTTEPFIHYITRGEIKNGFRCKICPNTFTTDVKLKEHCIVHKPTINKKFPFECHICKKSVSNIESLKDHYIAQHCINKPRVCPVCQKEFRQNSAYYKHKQCHAEPVMLSCPTCGKLFKRKIYLNIHLVTHTEERPYSCGICEKTFKDQRARNKHKKIHSGIKSYKCEVCSKRFLRKDGYMSHLVVHTKDRPYICSTCGRGFRTSSNCCRHSKSHK